MKYIGNKSRLLEFIETALKDEGVPFEGTFCDIFSGTASVGFHFKKLNMRIISNDLMTYSYYLQKVMLGMNSTPKFLELKKAMQLEPSESLEALLDKVSKVEKKRGYFFNNFSPSGEYHRQFFTDDNGMAIDAIRDSLDTWKDKGVINSIEFDYLLASLVNAADHVANMSGTYGAYLKIWRSVALKHIKMLPIEIYDNSAVNQIWKKDANELVNEIDGDILYLDPPYNSRQYASNFHVLESLCVWDKQELRGVVGLRDYQSQKSAFSSKKEAAKALRDLVSNANFKTIVLSYNNEGIIPREEIIDILSSRGKLSEHTTDYRRFRTERNHEKRKYKDVDDRVTEHLWLVKVDN